MINQTDMRAGGRVGLAVNSRPHLTQTLLCSHKMATRRPCVRAAAAASTTEPHGVPASRRLAAALVGSAAGLGLLLPGTGMALEAAATMPLQQEVAAVAAASLPADVDGQQETPPACYVVASDLSAAPELVTDAQVEATGPLCAEAKTLESRLVSGLGWMVEEAQEVTNFTESNFAAVGAPSSSMWLSNSPWCLMWDAYCNVLTARPVATKLATGMVGTFLGDMVAQAMQNILNTHASVTSRGAARGGNGSGSSSGQSSGAGAGGFQLDLTRTARLMGFSALVGTPVAFVWFTFLDQYVMPADPTSPLAVFSKVALDQVCMAPLMTSIFFAAMTYLEGCRSGKQVVDTVKSKLKPTLLANWTVWPVAHVINFALVPPAQRILYINVVNIAWTAFMSHMASSSEEETSATTVTKQAPAPRSQQLQQARR